MTATTSPLRPAALGYLRDAKVTVLHARCRTGAPRPFELIARVEGHRSTYTVDHIDDTWDCTCHDEQPCRHVAAVRLIAGDNTDTPAARKGQQP